MMKFCKKHRANPLVGYSPCPSCEIEDLREEVARLQAELAGKDKQGGYQPKGGAALGNPPKKS